MARQKGIITINGTLGDINFYTRLGQSLARNAGGGFNSESIKKHTRIAENTQEMGMASRANAVFRRSFRSLLVLHKDGTLHHRLQSLFMKIKNLDTISARGERTVLKGIATEQGKQLLRNFEFTPKCPTVLKDVATFDWASYTLSVSGFDMRAKFLKSADFMGVQVLAVCFDFDSLSFVTSESTLLELPYSDVPVNFSLQVAPLPPATGVCYAMIRTSYYQYVNDLPYLLYEAEHFGLELVSVV